jgi:hypothetical protein
MIGNIAGTGGGGVPVFRSETFADVGYRPRLKCVRRAT